MSSISDKLTYLNTTKEGIKTALNSMGASITDDAFRDYVEQIEGVYDNWEKVTGESYNQLLTPTIKAHTNLELKGNLEQYSLPSGYTSVDYLVCDGNQYIDTGIVGTHNSKIEMSIEPSDVSSTRAPFGNIEDTTKAISFNLNQSSSAITRWRDQTKTGSLGLTSGTKYIIIASKNGYYANGSLVWNPNISAYFTTNGNLLLFSHKASNTSIRYKGKFYYCKIYSNGTLLRYFVPCYRDSDSVVGVYDLVNGGFYTNSGTGSFTYNVSASIPNPDLPMDINVVTGENTVNITGKNLIPTQESDWEIGSYNSDSGNKYATSTSIRPKNLLPITPGTYYFSLEGDYKWLNVYYYDSNKNFISAQSKFYSISSYSNVAITIPKNVSYYGVGIKRLDEDDIFPEEILTAKPQVELGSYKTDFEEYNRQIYTVDLGDLELCKLGNYQDYIKKSTGKNLYNKEKLRFVSSNCNRTELDTGVRAIATRAGTGNVHYYFSSRIDASDDLLGKTVNISAIITPSASNQGKIKLYWRSENSMGSQIGTQALTSTGNANFEIPSSYPSGMEGIVIVFYANEGGTNETNDYVDYTNVMLSIGTEPQKYESYGNGWYKHKKIKNVELDGTETISVMTYTNNKRFLVKPTGYTDEISYFYSTGDNCKCDDIQISYKYTVGQPQNATVPALYCHSTGILITMPPSTNVTTTTNMSTWLGENKPMVYYVLNAEKTELIEDEDLIDQLDALEEAYSYDGNTNILTVNPKDKALLIVSASVLKKDSQ